MTNHPLLNHPLLGPALRLVARNKGPEVVANVRDALHPMRREILFEDLDELAAAKAQPELLSAMALANAHPQAIGDGTILQQLLDFLSAHWADILAIILKLLGIG